MSESMFKVDWISRSKIRGPVSGTMGPMLQALRDRFAPHALGVSVSYVDDRVMRKLNREHRGVDDTTDVLSFPAEPEPGAFPHLGDIVISLPVAEKMAKKLGVSRRREVQTLLIHGFLHLCGFDHEQDQGEMMALQRELEREFTGEEPLLMSLKRGRKPGSRVKVLKDGTRVVVSGRAAKAVARKAEERKEAEKAARVKTKAVKEKAKAEVKAVTGGEAAPVKRGPGRPRKNPEAATAPRAARKVVRRKKTTPARTGVIA